MNSILGKGQAAPSQGWDELIGQLQELIAAREMQQVASNAQNQLLRLQQQWEQMPGGPGGPNQIPWRQFLQQNGIKPPPIPASIVKPG